MAGHMFQRVLHRFSRNACLLLVLPVVAAGLRSRLSQFSQRFATKFPIFEHSLTKKLPAFSPSAEWKPGGNLEGDISNHSEGGALTEQYFGHNLTDNETVARKGSIAQTNTTPPTCSSKNTIFDFGFYDGADTKSCLEGGFCVLGVEADPYLVKQAVNNFAGWLYTGQLRLANVALYPPGDTSAWRQFYVNKCTREWNSFYNTTACRSCTPPHSLSPDACTAVSVRSMACLDVLRQFGSALYLKLDIEGAESGCFAALASPEAAAFLPQFLSAEITQLDYLDALHQIGYRSFKLVRQDLLHSGNSSRSGPWGTHAVDCRSGSAWRTYEEARQEFQGILAKPFNQHDPCPGGICGIHDTDCKDKIYMWYDVHVTWGLPQAGH